MTLVRLEQISKRFGNRDALFPLSLEIERGEIFGLLGHNGAGKSTTFGIMLGQVHPDSGDVHYGKHSIRRNRGQALLRVGAIFEAPAFYDYLTGLQNLRIFTAYTFSPPEKQLREVIELVGLTPRIQDRVRTYSHGMRQRLALAQALLPDPEFILLDEPSEGLDPEGIREMRELILRLRSERGLTFMLSSHLLSEVEQICDRVAILNQGRMLFCGKWQGSQTREPAYRLDLEPWEVALPILREFGSVDLEQNLARTSHDMAEIVPRLVEAGVKIRAIEPLKPTLEEFYLSTIHS